jgi:hypothetical protein
MPISIARGGLRVAAALLQRFISPAASLSVSPGDAASRSRFSMTLRTALWGMATLLPRGGEKSSPF